MDLGRKIAVTSALFYATISVPTALLFSSPRLDGTYAGVARFGGAAWALLLSFLVMLPLEISFVKKRIKV